METINKSRVISASAMISNLLLDHFSEEVCTRIFDILADNLTEWDASEIHEELFAHIDGKE